MSEQTTSDNKWMLEKLYRTRQYVVGYMTILKVNDREVTTGKTKIYVEELSVEKLRFICRVQIPENSKIVLGMRFNIGGQELDLKASILGMHANARKRKYTYLVELHRDSDKEEHDILTFVNKIQLANKQKKLRSVTETAVEME